MSSSAGNAPSPVAAGDLLLGRYRVVERIAEGGHSEIFRAEDERLRRPACIKLLRFPTEDPIFQAAIEERFVQEAFLLARLSHPATVKIFDFGYLRGRVVADKDKEIPFQVTELVSGGPLSRFVKKRGRLEPYEVVRVLSPLARALAEVHGAGIAHLDVKPQNILLSRTAAGREPKLADFGIAEAIATKVSTTGRSVLLYSVNWAAPEQMVGDQIGIQSDVYSLALVVAFALTGRLVFREPDPTRAYRLRKTSTEALLEAVAGANLPEPLVELLARAIHFEPRLRIADVKEFFTLVERTLSSYRDVPVPSPTTTEDSGPSLQVDPVGSERSLADRVTAANLWQLDREKPCPTIAGRRVEFVSVNNSVDLEGSGPIRVRVAFVAGDHTALHVKGLNCFVSAAGRRPTGAITIDGTTPLEFISAGGEVLGRAEVSFAEPGPVRTVVSLAGQSLVVATDSCRQLVAFDFGAGLTCALLCAED